MLESLGTSYRANMESRMEIEIMETPANDKLESCGSQIKLVNKYNQETIII